MSARAVTLALLALLVVAAPACGGDSGSGSGEEASFDTGEVEDFLLALQKRRTPDLTVAGPSCPDKVQVVKRARIRCTVSIEGVVAPYEVTLTRNGDEGRFTLRPAKPIIDTSKIVDLIRGRLDAGSRDARIDCGERIQVVSVGAKIPCTISVGGKTQRVRAVVTSRSGNVRVEGG